MVTVSFHILQMTFHVMQPDINIDDLKIEDKKTECLFV